MAKLPRYPSGASHEEPPVPPQSTGNPQLSRHTGVCGSTFGNDGPHGLRRQRLCRRTLATVAKVLRQTPP